jgi:CRISPR-associated protein Cas1
MHALAVMEQGTRLHLEGELIVLKNGEQVVRRVRLGEIREVQLFDQVEISSAALAVLARRGVDVLWLSRQGYFRGRMVGPRSPQAALHLAQLRRSLDEAFAARVAAGIVAGKITHQRQVLLRAQRRLQDEALADALGRLRLLAEECERRPSLERLRGLEGQAAALYFGQFGKLVIPEEFVFTKRTRWPPLDAVNACLSFGYTLLGGVVESEVLRCGLNPMLGFLHQPLHNRKSLALDLLEEFRPFVDLLVLRLVNRRQLGTGDFERQRIDVEEVLAEEDDEPGAASGTATPTEEQTGIYLNATGRKIFLKEHFNRLRETIYYPPREGAYELRDIIREQGYHLARVIEGAEEAYRAFVPG